MNPNIWQHIVNEISKELEDILGVEGIDENAISIPPDVKMGDIALACFQAAKQSDKNPVELASQWADSLSKAKFSLVDRVKASGPYVNFFLDNAELAKLVLENVTKDYGRLEIGKGKKVLVEFGCPNPLKVFHLGHLKNLITGESVARVFENAGYDVVRINYQGDVGMHIAKAMWGFYNSHDEKEISKLEKKSLEKRLEFLGDVYAKGAEAFEKSEESKKEIVEMNKKVYGKDPSIQKVYNIAVKWSLEYFDRLYKDLDTGFDRLYMESEVFERGAEITEEYLKKGVFKKSQGAVIYEGSKHGLHDRVFINSEGFPTYEAKDLGLAEMHFNDHDPDQVVHVVGKEQTDYFKVVFRAIEDIWPGRADKEYHLPGGYLQLKGQKKMSSRTGDVISGDELVESTRKNITEIMSDRDLKQKDEVVRKVTGAVLKYAMLKSDVRQDVAFDMEESISFSGDSGPYLLYIVARIKSIIKKVNVQGKGELKIIYPDNIEDVEKQLLLGIAEFSEIAQNTVDTLDPSKLAKYLFDLAQTFNNFYHQCPVLQADDQLVGFRLALIKAVLQVMNNGLHLLGIEIVEEM